MVVLLCLELILVLSSDRTRKAAGMYYEERWIDGKFCWRTSPNGAWTAYTANELAHRYQAELQRAHDLQRALDALQAQLRQVEGERAAMKGATNASS